VLKIIIQDPGHLIKLGKKEFRTPVSININGTTIEQVTTILRSQGISNFKIKEVIDSDLTKKPDQKSIVQDKQISQDNDKNGDTLKIFQLLIDKFQNIRNSDSKKLESRLENIENMITELVHRPISKFIGSESKVEKEEKGKSIFEEKEDMFVPKIETGGMKMQETSSIFKTHKSSEGAKETSELLSKLTKRKKE